MKVCWATGLAAGAVLCLLSAVGARAKPIDFELLEGLNVDVTVTDDLVRVHGEISFDYEGVGSFSFDDMADWIRLRFRTGEPLAITLIQTSDAGLPGVYDYLRWELETEIAFDGIRDSPGLPAGEIVDFYVHWNQEDTGWNVATGVLFPSTHSALAYWGIYGYLNHYEEYADVPVSAYLHIDLTMELRRIPTPDESSPLVLLGLSIAGWGACRMSRFGKV